MATRTTAVAMAAWVLGCATVRGPRPTGWIQDGEIEALAAYFAGHTDCRPGTADADAFLCPVAAMRIEPFEPPESVPTLPGIQVVARALPNSRWSTVIKKDRLLLLRAGRTVGVTAMLEPIDDAQAWWNGRVVEALRDNLRGRPAPVILPPWAEVVSAGLRAVRTGGPPVPWDWQPDRFFRVRNPLGGEAIVQVSQMAGPVVALALFPIPPPLSADERAAVGRMRQSLESEFAARTAASGLDEGKPPVAPGYVAWLAGLIAHQDVCHRDGALPQLCALSTVTAGGASLPRRDGIYAGLLYALYPAGDRWRSMRLQKGTLSVLSLGPWRFQAGTVVPDDREEADAISRADEAIGHRLSGEAFGPIETSASVLKDFTAFSRVPPLYPGGPFDHTPARLYEGRLPGGDFVYVFVAPRRGGGILVGLYPEVPWSLRPASERVNAMR